MVSIHTSVSQKNTDLTQIFNLEIFVNSFPKIIPKFLLWFTSLASHFFIIFNAISTYFSNVFNEISI